MYPESALDLQKVNQLNQELEKYSTEKILTWAWEHFGPRIVVSSSFQTQSVPLLYTISRIAPDMVVIFVDTTYHFPETLAFRDELIKRFDLKVKTVSADVNRAQLIRKYGQGLYRRDPDLCCRINKVEPMRCALEGMAAWISGIRRDQTPQRRNAQVLEIQGNRVKINPLVTWTEKDIWRTIHYYDLPVHPLLEQGYLSIGCAPCTRPVHQGKDLRAGRWPGTQKTECGLHTELAKTETGG